MLIGDPLAATQSINSLLANFQNQDMIDSYHLTEYGTGTAGKSERFSYFIRISTLKFWGFKYIYIPSLHKFEITKSLDDESGVIIKVNQYVLNQFINISRYSKSQGRIPSEKQNKEIDPKTLKNTNEYSSKS